MANAQTVTVTSGEFSSCAIEYTNVAGGNLLQATLGQTFATIDPPTSGGPEQPIVSAGFAETAVRYRYKGFVILADYDGSYTPINTVTLFARIQTASGIADVVPFQPDALGNIVIDSWANATFVNAISLKGNKWLRKRETVSLPANPAADLVLPTYTLLPGDITGDNITDLFDLIEFFNGYGASPTDPNWNNGLSDLNGDGIADLFDLITFFGNYGLQGDEGPE
jgi:hypothetical protein